MQNHGNKKGSLGQKIAEHRSHVLDDNFIGEMFFVFVFPLTELKQCSRFFGSVWV